MLIITDMASGTRLECNDGTPETAGTALLPPADRQSLRTQVEARLALREREPLADRTTDTWRSFRK